MPHRDPRTRKRTMAIATTTSGLPVAAQQAWRDPRSQRPILAQPGGSVQALLFGRGCTVRVMCHTWARHDDDDTRSGTKRRPAAARAAGDRVIRSASNAGRPVAGKAKSAAGAVSDAASFGKPQARVIFAIFHIDRARSWRPPSSAGTERAVATTPRTCDCAREKRVRARASAASYGAKA